MGLFKRVSAQQGQPAQQAPMTPNTTNSPGVPNLSAEIQRQLQTARSRVFSYSDYVKQVDCTVCGAPKRLPSKTAYLYCDNCGTLIDYDFRAANFDTNAALTNQVFQYLFNPVKTELEKAIVLRDKDRYRELLRPVYEEWLRQVPMAASPRATSDEEFREGTISYFVEGSIVREFNPQIKGVGDRLIAATNGIRRHPQPDGSVLVDESIWPVAQLYKQQMELTYQLIKEAGVLELEPEHTPVDIQLRMEYSVFCQNWLPKIPAPMVDQFLGFFGIRNEYAKATITDAQTRKCGNCGDELMTVPGAQAVVCESCGKKLDIAGGEVPCQNCGAPLSFPVGVSAIDCPYCHTGTHRV
jgi:LSD1 subclass zinc finger protein